MFASDEVIKGGISGYVFEQFEIACYDTLIVTAETVGDLEGAQVFRKIKVQEEEMAKWLAENLPSVTKKFLSLADTSDVDASH
jgi:ferritin-like metal-binding protein YciE